MENAAQILVVEDDVNIRETLAEILADERYVVLQAGHGRAALDLLQAGLRPNLLLLDLMMPVMTGWQLMEALQRDPALRDIPVVMFSAAAPKGGYRGAAAVLHKPLDLDVLLEAVGRHAR